MDEGSAYLLLDKNGEPLDILKNIDMAIEAAEEWAKGGSVYLDAPTEEDFRYIEAADQQEMALAANPRRQLAVVDDSSAVNSAMQALAAAMKRPVGELIDYDEAMSMSLPEAHRRLEPFFPTQKVTTDGKVSPVHYDRPMAMAQKLLGQNYKTEKGTPKNIISKLQRWTGFRKANVMGLSLLPSTQSYTEPMVKAIMASAKRDYGVPVVKPVRLNACVRATSECASSCLAFSGRNLADNYNTVKKFALLESLIHEPEAFIRMLWEAIDIHRANSLNNSVMPLVRLNVFSDLPWEEMVPQLFEDFSEVQFYDYTKVPGRTPPPNYDLTFSFAGTERNVEAMDREIREHGRRVAVVFAATKLKRLYEITYETVRGRTTKVRTGDTRQIATARKKGAQASVEPLGIREVPVKPSFRRKKPGGKSAVAFDAKLPDEFLGLPVIDGDDSDMRPYDPAPSIVGLRWKTPANQGVTLEEADVFIVLVDVVHTGGGYYSCLVSKTARFDDVDYSKYAADVTDD